MRLNFIKKSLVILFSITIIFNITACVPGNNKNITTQKNSDIQIYNKEELNEIIIGEWGIYSRFHNDPITKSIETIVCDSCPIIDFKKDGTATLTYWEGLGSKEYYKWKIRGNKLRLKLVSKEENYRRFEDSEYRMEINISGPSYTLKMFLTNQSGHILAKHT